MNGIVEDTEEEKSFLRDRMQISLKRKKKEDRMTYKLDYERRKVRQQGMEIPGRREELIKHEEIDKEISQRYNTLGKEKKETNEKE